MPHAFLVGSMEPTTATFFDLVRAPMEAVEARMRANPGPEHPALDAAIDHLLSSGGKRIRPTVALLTAGMLGADMQRAITLSAAIEMLHTATLVHDDLIDGALLRRGTPTLNARWTPGATVLTGDYIFARSAFLAAQTGSLPVIESFARTLMAIVTGEIDQLFRTHSDDLRKDYFDRIYAKTASLFELATEGAAILGAASPATIGTAKRFGYHLGLAFQIVDDVLDFVGSEQEVGKPVANDLRQGLITLPALCYLEALPDSRGLAEAAAEGRLEPAAMERLIADIRCSSAVDRAMEEARTILARGEASLATMPSTPERDALADLAEYIVQRTL